MFRPLLLSSILFSASLSINAIAQQDTTELLTSKPVMQGLDFATMQNKNALYGVTSKALLDCSALIVASEFIARQADASVDIGNEDLLMQAAINTIKDTNDKSNTPFVFDHVVENAKLTMVERMKRYVDSIIQNIEGESDGLQLEKDMVACAELGASVSSRFDPE
jgi:hypothetical protein